MIPLTGSAMMNGCGYLVTSCRIQVVSHAESLNWWLMPRMNTSRVMGSPPPGGRRVMGIRAPIPRSRTWGNRPAGWAVGVAGRDADRRAGLFAWAEQLRGVRQALYGLLRERSVSA